MSLAGRLLTLLVAAPVGAVEGLGRIRIQEVAVLWEAIQVITKAVLKYIQ